ncbi:FKBP-type peptidyl-prolyl cis-trans isomerase domain containing protein [Acidimicrobiia bacterium]
MGTAKRERQKAGQQARLNVERSWNRRDQRRRRVFSILGAAVIVVATAALFIGLSDNSSTSTTAATTTSTTLATSTTISATTLPSAAGKPCVAFNDTLPAGAPEVTMPVGEVPTSLVVEDLIKGTGTPVVAGDSVTVNYIGVSCSTGKIFDSSWANGKPITFPLNQVITGWAQGLVGMQPNGRRLLVIPADLGYGSTGQGGIAPDESLIFVVDLISASPSATPGTTPN